MYTGKPWLNSGWTEFNPGVGLHPNPPGDRRMHATIPYFSLQAGERKSIDMVLGYGQDSSLNTIGQSVPELFQVLNSAKSAWDTLPRNTGIYSNNYSCNQITDVRDNEPKVQRLLIYPNPSNGRFSIESSEDILAIQVYDMQGRELLNQSINMLNTTSIDLSEYNNGFFVVRVQTKEKTWFTQKVALFK